MFYTNDMKKIITFTLIILIIPFLIVSLMIREDKKEKVGYNINTKMNIKVKRENGEIEKIPFEDYIIGVVAAEMPVSFELEALKAQAVAARSYVLKKIEQNKNNDYDILDTVMNQVYINNEEMKQKWKDKYEENYKKIKRAVDETKGEYLTYNGNIIEAFFFSTSSGMTENSEDVFTAPLPYLRSVESNWDNISPVFRDNVTLSLKEFYYNLGLDYSDKLDIKILERSNTGHIKKIKINNVEFKGTEVRKKLNLRSTYFEIKKEGNNIIVNTLGYGHGVGMSQYGANGMAKDGYSYIDILKHYYQGVEISKK